MNKLILLLSLSLAGQAGAATITVWNHFTGADEVAWIEALDCMAGEELADWMPSKVSFDSEDGEMVMKLEYSGRTADDNTRIHDGDGITRTFNIRDPARFGPLLDLRR